MDMPVLKILLINLIYEVDRYDFYFMLYSALNLHVAQKFSQSYYGKVGVKYRDVGGCTCLAT